jgi:hypothetical protein
MIERRRQRGPDGDISRDIDHGPRSAVGLGSLRRQGYIACDTMPNAMPSKLLRANGDTFDLSRVRQLSGAPSFMRPRRAA